MNFLDIASTESQSALPTREDGIAFAKSGIEIDPRIPAAVPGFDAPFWQAGLAGYSDAAMRIIARRHGCPFCMTESLLDRMLLAGGKAKSKADLSVLEQNVPASAIDHPLGGQVIGSEPNEMGEAAALLATLGYDTIDVNLACPVKKIGRKCRGGHLLTEPELAREMLREVRQAVPSEMPTTVKMRRAWDDSSEASDRFNSIFESAYELGYSWVTVHGRTVEQKYNGPSNWDFLRELVRRYSDRVIFGSGDIWEAADIFRMMMYTGVHAVSVARGCIGNPWIFREARLLMKGEFAQPPTMAEQREVLREHFELCMAEHGEKLAGRLMRKFGIKFSQHHPDAEEVHRAFVRVKTLTDWERVIDTLYTDDVELITKQVAPCA